MTICKIIIWLYILLCIGVISDEVTTHIGLKQGLGEKNQLYIHHFWLNLSLKVLALVLMGLVGFYFTTVTKNIILIMGKL